jgi:antitoxin (DNA-binding transcriptional repressor) of toxin-antitoxin stability system
MKVEDFFRFLADTAANREGQRSERGQLSMGQGGICIGAIFCLDGPKFPGVRFSNEIDALVGLGKIQLRPDFSRHIGQQPDVPQLGAIRRIGLEIVTNQQLEWSAAGVSIETGLPVDEIGPRRNRGKVFGRYHAAINFMARLHVVVSAVGVERILAFAMETPEVPRVMKTATVRQLRTQFHQVRKMVEKEGEVVLTERGRPAFVISEHPGRQTKKISRSKKTAKFDYYARLINRMPEPISAEASRAFDDFYRAER